jgi:uncharacterized membrane protein
VHSPYITTAVSAAASAGDALTWWLASVCALAFVLATGGAILISAYQRRQRVPHPHYHRHSPTDIPPDE